MAVDCEKLIYLIEARSPIYNYQDEEHSNKIIVDKLWAEIATEMNCTVSECKNKWTSLRNSFSRQLRDERNKPSKSHGKQKKKWYLTDAMEFLRDHVNQHGSTSSIFCSPDIEENGDEISLVESAISLNETQSTGSPAKDSPVPCKRPKLSVSEMVARPMIEFLQSRTKDKSPDDASTLFFKSMLADYHKLSSKRQRTFKVLMMNSMNKMQEEEENEARHGQF